MTLPDLSKIFARSAENWPAKALSIALALILFVFHRMSTLEDRFFSVPLEVELNNELLPASPYTRMIRVNLRGEANSIYPILEEDIEAYIDLKQYTKPGTYRAPIKVRKQGTALGVEPLQISVDPMEITMELDQRMSKYVPLTANLRGKLAAGYELSSYSLNPTQVVVDGPLNLLGSVSEFYTDFIDLDGRSTDFSATVSILNRDPLLTIRGNGLTEFRGFVSRTVPVRNLTDIPFTLKNLDGNFTASVQPTGGNIRIEGSQADLDGYVPAADLLSVDCSQIHAEGEYDLPVTVSLPRGMTMLRQDPSSVKILVTAKADGGAAEESADAKDDTGNDGSGSRGDE